MLQCRESERQTKTTTGRMKQTEKQTGRQAKNGMTWATPEDKETVKEKDKEDKDKDASTVKEMAALRVTVRRPKARRRPPSATHVAGGIAAPRHAHMPAVVHLLHDDTGEGVHNAEQAQAGRNLASPEPHASYPIHL